MAKSKISPFHSECKRILSSISGRTCRYMYVNIPGFEDYLFITNGDLHILSSYRPYILAVHLVKPNELFLEQLFKLIDNPKDDIYLYRTDFILKGLQEAGEFNFKYNHLSDGTMTVTNLINNELVIVKSSTEEEEYESNDESLEDDITSIGEDIFDSVKENDDKVSIDKRNAKIKSNSFVIDKLKLKEIAGSIIKHPYIKDQLLDISEQMYNDHQGIISNTISHVSFKYNPLNEINIVHRTWYESGRFKATDFTPAISDTLINTNHEQVLVLIKGLDAPSINEYIAKMIPKPKSKSPDVEDEDNVCSLYQHIYTRNGLNVNHISHFSMKDDIEILSSRPYSDIILYKKHIQGVN